MRADYLDEVVWDHITALLADPALIRGEISKRLEAARTSDPVTSQRKRLQAALAKATASITAMIEAFSEQLVTIDELRARMPHLRARETGLRGQFDALDAQAADQDVYLKLADDLEGFLAQLRGNAVTATVEDRQKVLRLLVKDILIGPEKITIRHRIPARPGSSSARQRDPEPDTEGDHRRDYLLRWGREDPGLRRVRLRLFPGPRPPGAQSLIHLGAVKSAPGRTDVFKAVEPGRGPRHSMGRRRGGSLWRRRRPLAAGRWTTAIRSPGCATCATAWSARWPRAWTSIPPRALSRTAPSCDWPGRASIAERAGAAGRTR